MYAHDKVSISDEGSDNSLVKNERYKIQAPSVVKVKAEPSTPRVSTSVKLSLTLDSKVELTVEQLKKYRRNERDRRRSCAKRETMEQMRRAVAALELQKQQLIQHIAANSPCSSPGSDYRSQSSRPDLAMSTSPSLYPTPSTPVTRDDYVQLAAEIEEYRRQNAAMVEELARHELFNNSLRYRLKSFPRLDSLCGLQLTQLKHDDCINFVSQTLKCIDDIRLQYANDEEFLNRPEFLGWSQYSNRQGEVVNFIIRKELRNVTPQQLMDRTWQLQTDNDSLRRLGPSHIQTNITMLQKITDDILVIDRKTEDHSHTIENTRPLVLRTIHMLFRVAHDDGTQTMGIKTLDTPIGDRIQHDEEVWWDIFYWIRVAPSNSSKEITTITEFGGTNLCECEEHATTWLKELMFLAIRWEAVVVAPFLLKQ